MSAAAFLLLFSAVFSSSFGHSSGHRDMDPEEMAYYQYNPEYRAYCLNNEFRNARLCEAVGFK
jgi:hypothetical protein